MRTVVVILFVVTALLECIVAPPVTEKKSEEDNKEKNEQFQEMGIEYNRYLVQVVEALESDPEFRKKLENATSEDIQSGKIAEELDFVSHNVRTKLDELKRVELERLRKLLRQAYEYENDIDTKHMKIPDPEHLDHSNPHTFEIADLKKLITKTAEDLAEADKKRREEFKSYEMEKEFEKQQKLKEMDEEKKKKYLEELEEQKKKHKKHDPLHHPGSKQQLEEVWEKQDHMENQEFDPKAFFFMHDELLCILIILGDTSAHFACQPHRHALRLLRKARPAASPRRSAASLCETRPTASPGKVWSAASPRHCYSPIVDLGKSPREEDRPTTSPAIFSSIP